MRKHPPSAVPRMVDPESTADSSTALDMDDGEEESMQDENETQEISPSDQEDSKQTPDLFERNESGGDSTAAESEMEVTEEGEEEEEDEDEEEDQSEPPNFSEGDSEPAKSDVETDTDRPDTAVTSEDDEDVSSEEEEESDENTENEEPPPPDVPPAKKKMLLLPPARKMLPGEPLPPKPLAKKPTAPSSRSRTKASSPKRTGTKAPVSSKAGPSSKKTATAPEKPVGLKAAAKVLRKPSPIPRSPKQPSVPPKKRAVEGTKTTIAPPPGRSGGKQLVTIGKNRALMDDSTEKKKKKKKKKEPTYHKYIFAAFRQVYPAVSENPHTVSTGTMGIVNSMMNDMFERLATEASRLTRMNKSRTLGAREIRTATLLIIPGELRKHAVAEGDKALHRYNLSQKERKEAKTAGDKEREKGGHAVLQKKGG